MLKKISESRLCAFCKLDHRVYLKSEVSVFDVSLLLAVTALMAFAIWGGPDLRSLLIFMTLAFSMQVFFRVRYRESVKCPHCGFDPILYSQNAERAAQKVKSHMEKRKNNPEFMLKPQPQIKPIYKTRDEIEAEKAIALAAEQGSEEALSETPEPPKAQFIDSQI